LTPEEFDRQVELVLKGKRGPIIAGEVGDELNLRWVEEYKAAARRPKREARQRSSLSLGSTDAGPASCPPSAAPP